MILSLRRGSRSDDVARMGEWKAVRSRMQNVCRRWGTCLISFRSTCSRTRGSLLRSSKGTAVVENFDRSGLWGVLSSWLSRVGFLLELDPVKDVSEVILRAPHDELEETLLVADDGLLVLLVDLEEL